MIGWDTLYIEWLSVNNYGIYRVNPLIELLSVVLITRNVYCCPAGFKRVRMLTGIVAVIR